MDLYQWSWLFLAAYIGLMVSFGVIGQRRVSGADDFAVARQSYGPLVLALAGPPVLGSVWNGGSRLTGTD